MMLGDALADAPPRRAKIKGQPHFLAYINEEEAAMLRDQGGGMERGGQQIVGPGGVPAFYDADGNGNAADSSSPTGGPNDSESSSNVSDNGAAGPDFSGAGQDIGGFGGDANNSGGNSTGADLGGPFPESAPSALGPAGPSAADLAALAAQRLAARRGAAAGGLRSAWDGRIGDSLFDAREAAFRGTYPGQIDQSYQDKLLQSLRGMDPELRETPIAWNVQRGLADQRDAAKGGLTQAWESAESRMRGRATSARDAAIGRVQGSDDPDATLMESMAELDNLAAEFSGYLPNYEFTLDAGNPANGVVNLTRPGEQEQIQAERLRLLLRNLPSLNSSTVVA